MSEWIIRFICVAIGFVVGALSLVGVLAYSVNAISKAVDAINEARQERHDVPRETSQDW